MGARLCVSLEYPMRKICPECRSAMNGDAPHCDSCGCNFRRAKPTPRSLYRDVTLAAGTLLGVAGAIAGLLWAVGAGRIR
jgi:hypothetical protein